MVGERVWWKVKWKGYWTEHLKGDGKGRMTVLQKAWWKESLKEPRRESWKER